MTPLWIIGSGGHAKVTIETARSMGLEIAGCLDDNPAMIGQAILGVLIQGPANLESIAQFNIQRAIIAIGLNQVRQRIAAKLEGHIEWATLVHSHAIVSPTAILGSGTLVCADAVIQADTSIGQHCIINTSASVDHDGLLGDFVHMAPGSRLAANLTIDTGVFAGIGSVMVPGVRVGEWSIVGAGAVVTRDLPANVTAVGAPAKVIKERELGWQLGKVSSAS